MLVLVSCIFKLFVKGSSLSKKEKAISRNKKIYELYYNKDVKKKRKYMKEKISLVKASIQ